MIQVRNLRKSFGGDIVLRGVNLDVRDAETLVIIGDSGSGKSVLLKHLCGLMKPDSGQVIVDGTDIVTLSEEQLTPIRMKFGVEFQGTALFDSMTVFDNVAFPLRERLQLPEPEIEKRVDRALAVMELLGAKDKKPAELSGGMQRRVALARACVPLPPYVVYDDPTAGLDPILAKEICRYILEMRNSYHTTNIVATYDMTCAASVADRIAMLHEGVTYAMGTPKQIWATSDPFVRKFVAGVASLR